MSLNPKKCIFEVILENFLGYLVSFQGIKENLDKTISLINMRSIWFLKGVQQLNGCIRVLNHFVSKCTGKCLHLFQLLKKNKEYLWSKELKSTFQSIKEYLGKAPVLTNPNLGEVLYLYLPFIEREARAIIMVDRDG